MVIGLDMDSVIADLTPHLYRFHNVTYGTDITVADHTDYNLGKLMKCEFEEAVKRVYGFYYSPYFDDVKPVPGSQQAIEYFNKEHELHVITSRPYEIQEKTISWIKEYFPIKTQNIHFTNQFTQGVNSGVTKSFFCRELKTDIMIEDALEYAIDCASCNIDILLLDMPWNQSNELPTNIHRLLSWEEISDYVTKKVTP